MAGPALNWQLRRLAVCASTEVELDRWLRRRDPTQPLAAGLVVMANQQRFGHGQRGRVWQSPPGGLWISAAFPWPSALEASAALGLAAAVGLAEQLEALGVAVSLKWPNDLLVGGRKLAGLLPRLRLRGGRVRWAQVGLGLNGTNRPPQGGVSVAQVLAGGGFHPRAKPKRMLPLALAALERAQQLAVDPEQVRLGAEVLLLRPPEGYLHAGERWQVVGLECDGGLRLQRPGAAITLQRSF